MMIPVSYLSVQSGGGGGCSGVLGCLHKKVTSTQSSWIYSAGCNWTFIHQIRGRVHSAHRWNGICQDLVNHRVKFRRLLPKLSRRAHLWGKMVFCEGWKGQWEPSVRCCEPVPQRGGLGHLCPLLHCHLSLPARLSPVGAKQSAGVSWDGISAAVIKTASMEFF